MKKLIVIFFIAVNYSIFPQEITDKEAFSSYKVGLLAGINFYQLTGTSVIVEAKTNLTSDIYAKFSVGYSVINKKEGYNVKTYGVGNYGDIPKYATSSYNIDRINYDVFPLSLGIEYIFTKNRFSPYGIFEIGYNYYTFHIEESNRWLGIAGYYNSFDELPTAYKNKEPIFSKDESYRLALGVGTNIKLTSAINFDVRYIYQFNKSIINTNQILVGINF
jgi:hypothetical protein